MPRPVRIEYENAFYHVMNRGRSRNNIFFKAIHYLDFLKVIQESCDRFNCVIHSYCLMPNHYHLLIQTRDANLGRIMRHINGVYTQRFNKIQKIDGPLFRGRYKAILVESGKYLLELSKYIHRNPIETKSEQRRLVKSLQDYEWSSYQNYLGITQTPKWLNKELTFSKFKADGDQVRRYQLFVEREESEELERFFSKKNQGAILGTDNFKERVLTKTLVGDKIKQNRIRQEIRKDITIDEIINVVAKVFSVTTESILEKQDGRPRKNIPRSLVMYLIQEIKDTSLQQIAEIFGLKHYGSVSYSTSTIKTKIDQKVFVSEVGQIENILYFTQEA